METRRGIIKSGMGLAAIIAAGKAPAALVKSMIVSRETNVMISGGGWKNPYVTDGLIGMWDGEWNAGPGIHDATATTWVDLIGDVHSIPLTNVSHLWGNNYFHYSRGAGAVTTPDDVYNAVWSNDGFSADICLKTLYSPAAESKSVFWGGKYNPMGSFFSTNDNNIRVCFSDGSGVSISRSANANILFSVNYANGNYEAYLNGVSKTSAYRQPGTKAAISDYGIGVNSFAWSGFMPNVEYYGIRLYNRVRAAAEIAANYEMDKARFNLP